MADEMKPWQAQELFNSAAEEVKAPMAIQITPQSRYFTISWQKRPGKIDRFVILFGSSPDNLREYGKGVPAQLNQFWYMEVIKGLQDGKDYYITVLAEKDSKRSSTPGIWKVVTGPVGQYVELVKIDVPAPPIQTTAPVPETTTPPPTAPKTESEQPPPIIHHNPNVVATCASCLSEVVLDNQQELYVCQGCAEQYVQVVATGKYIPVKVLKNGLCNCCKPKRGLIQPPGTRFKKCSYTGQEYIDIAGLGPIRITELDYGICTCCNPPSPLILNQQSQVICAHQRDHLYVRQGSSYVYHPPEAPVGLVDEINDWLADGTAGMQPGGIITNNPKRRR